MDSISAQEATKRLVELIQVANEDKCQFRITSEVGNVVVLPEETYENILVTLELLSTPGLMDNLNFCDMEDKIEQMTRVSNH
jgi:PHD/YefM family antitoxin component YafN of YafNO toxin-antitoxin module